MNQLTPFSSSRYLSLDFLRGIALFGILLLNIESFAYPASDFHNYSIMSKINYYSWFGTQLLFEGSMRGLFSILFGASCIMILSKNHDVESIDIYYRRLLWLFLFGLFNAYVLLWHGDILYGYAIAGMFLFPFRKLNPKWLIIIGLSLSFMVFARSFYKYTFDRRPKYLVYSSAMSDSTMHHKPLSLKQKEAIQTFENMGAMMEKDTAAIKQERVAILGNYKAIFDKRWKDGEFLQTWKIYDMYNFWDSLMLMFVGMALFKMEVLTGVWPIKKYLLLALLCFSIAIPLRFWYLNSMYYDFEGFKAFYAKYVIPTGSTTEFSRMLQSIGLMALLMAFYKTGWLKRLVKIVSKVGQMALTNYLLQSIICGLFYYGIGFGMFDKLEIHQNYIFVVFTWVFSIAFSNIWLHFFKFGPFEWLWRCLTYWRWFSIV